MADDPLYAPLGMAPAKPMRERRRVPLGIVAALLVIACAGGAAAFLARHNPATENGVAVATIEAAPPQRAAPPAAPVPAPPPAAGPPGSTVEVQNGVKIVRLNPSGSASPVSLPVEPAPAAPLAPAPDPRVSEPSPDGALPRIGQDGSRPSTVYARPVAAVGGPRVALVAAGAGLDQLGSAEAARSLPPAIDFAFPPDAPDVRTQVAETRRAGREVVLDLGAGVDGKAVRRSLARWSGYVGVRLPADGEEAAREAEGRGLVVVRASGAEVVVDAADGVGLGAALGRLADAARANGQAVGVVQNAIAGRDALVRAAAELAAAGVTLVPLSALAAPRAAAAAR